MIRKFIIDKDFMIHNSNQDNELNKRLIVWQVVFVYLFVYCFVYYISIKTPYIYIRHLKKIISLSSPRASFWGPHQISFYFPDFFYCLFLTVKSLLELFSLWQYQSYTIFQWFNQPYPYRLLVRCCFSFKMCLFYSV